MPDEDEARAAADEFALVRHPTASAVTGSPAKRNEDPAADAVNTARAMAGG